jgi:outer membrane scaffolding protein for murein synthesis (MipA/OmpV family)
MKTLLFIVAGLLLPALAVAASQPADVAARTPLFVEEDGTILDFQTRGAEAGREEETSPERVERKPLWEAGVTGIALTLPHYPGSDEYYTFALPFPYFVYRGEFIQSDRDGLRGLFFQSDRFESDLSLGGNLPVSSQDNEARKGMPELDTLAEIGPAVRCYFHRRGALDHLYLQAAWRGAFSIAFNGGFDIDTHWRGQRYTLNLRFKNESLFRDLDLGLFLSAGISYADDILNGYFYDVQPQFVAPDRGHYNADAGYAGLYASVAAYKALSPPWAVGGYCSWYNISGAVFEDSPLVRTGNNFYAGLVLVWKFAQSEKMAAVADEFNMP